VCAISIGDFVQYQIGGEKPQSTEMNMRYLAAVILASAVVGCTARAQGTSTQPAINPCAAFALRDLPLNQNWSQATVLVTHEDNGQVKGSVTTYTTPHTKDGWSVLSFSTLPNGMCVENRAYITK
jgi:hypothetical protein